MLIVQILCPYVLFNSCDFLYKLLINCFDSPPLPFFSIYKDNFVERIR